MAKLKPIRIDDQTVIVQDGARLADVVLPEVQSVRTDQGALVTREQFANVPVPAWFETTLSAINKGGAPKADKHTVVIDGAIREVPQGHPLSTVVSPDVDTVRTSDGALISRQDFRHVPIPAGFETNLSRINKGGTADSRVAPARMEFEEVIVDPRPRHVSGRGRKC